MCVSTCYYLEEHDGKWVTVEPDQSFRFLFQGFVCRDLSEKLRNFIRHQIGNADLPEDSPSKTRHNYGVSWMTLTDFITWCDDNKIGEISPKFTEKLKEFQKEGVDQRIIWMIQ